MTTQPNRPQQVRELLSEILDHGAAPDRLQRLSELLGDDPEACEAYLEQITLHAELHREFGGGLGRMSPVEAIGLPLNARDVPSSRNTSSSARFRLLAALIAAIALVVIVSLVRPRRAESPAPAAYVASLHATTEAEWDMDGRRPTNGDRLKQGDLRLASGLAELELFDGAVVVIEGPTHLYLSSPNRVVLHSGRLAAGVPPRAIGFVVETPAGAVVDQGTSFGVRVEATGVTETQVFEGRVDVLPSGRRLFQDSAVRLEPGGRTPTAIEPDARRYPSPPRQLSPLASGGFEPGTVFLNQGVPTRDQVWSGDTCALVSAEQGVEPFEGRRMLKFVSTGDSELAGYNTRASQQWQLIDLRPLAADVAQGRVFVEASARLNRVVGDQSTDALLGLAAYAFQGDPASAQDAWERRGTERRGGVQTEIPTDDDPATWEQVHVRLHVPRRTDYLLLEVRAIENVQNDADLPEFDGHYADDVRCELRIAPRPAR